MADKGNNNEKPSKGDKGNTSDLPGDNIDMDDDLKLVMEIIRRLPPQDVKSPNWSNIGAKCGKSDSAAEQRMAQLTNRFLEVTKDEVPVIPDTKKRNRGGKTTKPAPRGSKRAISEVEDNVEEVSALPNAPKRGRVTKNTKIETNKDAKKNRTHQAGAAPKPRQAYLSAVADPSDGSRANETFAEASRRQALEAPSQGYEDSESEDESNSEDDSNSEDVGDEMGEIRFQNVKRKYLAETANEAAAAPTAAAPAAAALVADAAVASNSAASVTGPPRQNPRANPHDDEEGKGDGEHDMSATSARRATKEDAEDEETPIPPHNRVADPKLYVFPNLGRSTPCPPPIDSLRLTLVLSSDETELDRYKATRLKYGIRRGWSVPRDETLQEWYVPEGLEGKDGQGLSGDPFVKKLKDKNGRTPLPTLEDKRRKEEARARIRRQLKQEEDQKRK
ncbi:hypothetical protein PG984_011651 [Apiospora sp. TS-2023a]